MLPLRPQKLEYERPMRKAARKYKLPYPPTKKPIPLYRDEFYDPYRYFPTRRMSQKLSTRPSNTPPRSIKYEIVDRILGGDGLPTYIVREVTHNHTVQDCKVPAEGAAREQESGSERNERKAEETVSDPIYYVQKEPLNRNVVTGALGRYDRISTLRFPSSRQSIPASGGVNADAGTFQVPFTKINSYVSPLQLERFENYRFRNPKPDDLPYKISTPLSLVTEIEPKTMEREIKPVEWLWNKRRKLDRSKRVARGVNHSTRIAGIGASTGTSSRTPNQGDDDKIDVIIDNNGTDELLKSLRTISQDEPRLLRRRSFSKFRTFHESTTTSSKSDILNPHLAPSIIALNGTADSYSVPATSSAASSLEENQNVPHLSSIANIHRQHRKKKSLTANGRKTKRHTPRTPRVEIEELSTNGSDQVYEVSRILKHNDVDNVRYYQVSWTGFAETEENLTWLTEEELQGAPKVLRRYLKYLETGIYDIDDIDDSDDSNYSDNEGNDIGKEDARAIRRALAEGVV